MVLGDKGCSNWTAVPDLFGEVPLLLTVQLEHHDGQMHLLC